MKEKSRRSLLTIALVFSMLLSLTACGRKNVSDTTASIEISDSEQSISNEENSEENSEENVSNANNDSKEANSMTSVVGEEELAKIRETAAENGCAISVAYLGFFDMGDDYLQEYLDYCGARKAFPFVDDIPLERLIRTEGSELYLIVPTNPNATIRVNDWVIDETNGYYGEVGSREYYFNDTGEPFLLECNISDIMPNTVIRVDVEKNGKTLEYNPALSLKDGTLNYPGVYETNYGVLDITLYDEVNSAAGLDTMPDAIDYASIISGMQDNSQLLAVAFLGWFGSTWEYLPSYLEEMGYTEAFPFLEDITEETFVCGEGEELYLIVPRDPNATISVNQLDEVGLVEEVLYHSQSGEPILIQGNIGTYMGEDVHFNLELNIVEDYGDSLTCYPGRDFNAAGVLNALPILDLKQKDATQ